MAAGASASVSVPLTTRGCADFLGFTTEWIRQAIDAGVKVEGRRARVRLEAERILVGRRRTYRIHFDAFVAFCDSIGWRRLPASAADVRSQRRERTVREPVSVAAGR